MTRTILALLIVSVSWANDGNVTKSDLIDLEKRLAAAVLAVDFDTLDTIYADDFLFTHSTGDVDTKSTWIDGLRSGSSSYTARSVDQIKVELHGIVAVTSGRIHAKSESSNPRWREYSIWYIRVYEVRNGRWQLLSHRSIREETGPLPD